MSTLKDVQDKLTVLSREIGSVLRLSTYDDYDDLSGLEINYENPDELLLHQELRGVMDHLDKAKVTIDYLNKEIIYTSELRKNLNDRYETVDGKYEFTSGNGIEALVDDGFYDVPYWVVTRIEHDGTDYYLVGYKNVSLQGLKIRKRK